MQYETIIAIRMPTSLSIGIRRIASYLSALLLTTLPLQASKLSPFAQIEALEIRECSGIAKSRQYESVYWTHNDSGSGSAIYAIRSNGELIAAIDTHLPNIDWEDATVDSSGGLFLADTGNFENTRRDLVIHRISEPNPSVPNDSLEISSYPFVYPDQTAFPPMKRQFDCEALFWAQGRLHLLTKSLGDTYTRLYRFDALHENRINRPSFVARFDIGPRVTAAEASMDGNRLAILTTRSVWVFDKPDDSSDFFQGPAFTRSIQAGQCEAICWEDESTLLVANEGRDLYRIPIDTLIEY